MRLQHHQAISILKKSSSRSRLLLAESLQKIAHSQGVRVGNSVAWHPFPLELIIQNEERNQLESLVSSIVDLELRSLNDPELFQRLNFSLSPGGRWLVHQGLHNPVNPIHRFRRFDGFLKRGQFATIEINQIAPLGHYTYDCSLARAQVMLEHLGVSWEPKFMYQLLAKWMRELYALHRSGEQPKLIAVSTEFGYQAKQQELPGTIKNLNRYAIEQGWDTRWTLAEPPQFSIKNGDIYVHGHKADMLWRNSVYLTPYRASPQQLIDYEYICSNPKQFLVINDTRSWLSATKEALAILWEEHRCRDILPATYSLGYCSEAILKQIVTTKEHWITKPTDSSSGNQVVFGAHTSEEEWSRLCFERQAPGYIAQEYLKPDPMALIALNKSGDLIEQNYTLDVCPYSINNQLSQAILCRALPYTQVGLMNLTEGALPVPCVIKDNTLLTE